jgi:hypothetical protein
MDGRVLINLMRASENSNPDELASDFIGFLNASSLTKRVLFVREYSKN